MEVALLIGQDARARLVVEHGLFRIDRYNDEHEEFYAIPNLLLSGEFPPDDDGARVARPL